MAAAFAEQSGAPLAAGTASHVVPLPEPPVGAGGASEEPEPFPEPPVGVGGASEEPAPGGEPLPVGSEPTG